MAEDGMDAERAARLFGENVVNALVDAIEKRMKTEDDDDREDRLAATQHRLDSMCSIVDGLVRKLDGFETQVSTCAEVVKSVGDPRLAMRRNVEAFVTQMEDRIGEKVDRLDKLVRAVCDRLDQQGQLLATAAEGVGYAKAECMRLDEIARQQSERIDVNVCHGTNKISDLDSNLRMAARVDSLSKSVGEVERAIENRDDPDRFLSDFERIASTELAAANEAADRRERDSDAGWRSKNGVRPGDMIGLGSFIPDPTTTSIDKRTTALELAHAEIRRLTMALETVKARLHESIRERSNVVTEGGDVRYALESSRAQVHVLRTELERAKAKMYEEGRTHQTTLADAHAMRNQITAIDKDRTELRAEIRRLVENGGEHAERMQAAVDEAKATRAVELKEHVALAADHTEQLEWRKTAEEVVKRASALITTYAAEGNEPVFRMPSSPQIAARMNLAETIELHEKACSERASDLPF